MFLPGCVSCFLGQFLGMGNGFFCVWARGSSNINAPITVVGAQPTVPKGMGCPPAGGPGSWDGRLLPFQTRPRQMAESPAMETELLPGTHTAPPWAPAPRLLRKVSCSLGYHRLHGGSLSGGHAPPPAIRVTPRVPSSPPLTGLQHSAMRCCPPTPTAFPGTSTLPRGPHVRPGRGTRRDRARAGWSCGRAAVPRWCPPAVTVPLPYRPSLSSLVRASSPPTRQTPSVSTFITDGFSAGQPRGLQMGLEAGEASGRSCGSVGRS